MKSHRRMHAKTNAIITLNVLTESACVRQDTPGMDWIVAVSTVKQTSRKRTILRQGTNEAVVPFVNGHCHFWDT